MDHQIAVELENLTKVFRPPLRRIKKLFRRPGPDEVVALRNVTLTIREGEIFGLVGRNGQGKTTLVKSIAVLLVPTSGSIKVFGADSLRMSQEVKRRTGLVTSDERSFYWRLTGWQNMLFFARLFGMNMAEARRRIEKLFESFDMKELGHRPFREYSNGNKQRLALARALLPDPSLMLLDEPTRSLDPIAADELRQLISERVSRSGKRTVVITSHNLAEIEQLCDRVAILSRGEVKECATLDDLRAKYRGREEITVRFRWPGTLDSIRQSFAAFPAHGCEEVSRGVYKVRLTRLAGDDSLHLLMDGLISSGATVVSCETNQLGLKEIMQEIDRED